MKKCIIFAAACVCVLALAMPAMADLKITGATNLDMYWFNHDKENTAGGVAKNATTALNDRTEFHMNVRRPNNFIQFAYTNDDGTLGAVMRLRGGQSDESNFNTEQIHFGINYIWWKPAPNTTFQIGTIYQIVGGLAPSPTNLGHQFGGTGGPVGINYGNLHTSERDGIGLYQKINQNIGIEIGIYDPEDDNDAVSGQALPLVAGVAAQQEEEKWPRVDLGIPIKFGNFQFKPKGTWLTKEYDQVLGGSEDSFDIWAVSLDARWTFGPFRLSGEYTTGENLSEGNHTGATGAATVRTRNYIVPGTASTKFSDTEQDLWWLEAKYQFSKSLAIYASYGEYEGKNDVSPATTADDWDVETSYWGVILEYKVLPNFILYPTYANFDAGDDNQRGANVRVDNGTQQVYGVKFQLLW
jgi:hypothetical protein